MRVVQLIHPFESLPHDEDGDVVLWIAVPDGAEVRAEEGSPWEVTPTCYNEVVPGTDIIIEEVKQ